MLTKHLHLALLGAALLATPAPAQTGTPASGATGAFMTQIQPGQWRLSSFRGLNVYNEANEKVGDISELIFSRDGKVVAAVIGVGGFLGLGEHSVAVPFDQIKFMDQPRAMAANTATSAAPSADVPAPASPTAPAGSAARAPAGAPDVTATGSTATAGREVLRVGPDHAVLNMTRDQLKAAPEFKTR